MRGIRRIVAIAAILAVATAASAALRKGPYLQNPTTDAISVLWETNDATLDTLEYGIDENLGNVLQDPSSTKYHQHRITGLEPETAYYYRVTSDGNPGALLRFYTATDVCSPFQFVLVGDTRTDHITHRTNVEQMAQQYPDFVLNSGDIIDHGDTPEENEEIWQMFFFLEQDFMDEVPIYPVFGNHDSGTEDIWDRVFDMPSDESGSEQYYSFRYGNSAFCVINTQESIAADSPQVLWLESALEKAHDDPQVQHIFVTFHIPGFSAGEHPSYEAVQENLIPLFEAYDVQAVLNGHDHNFQHMEKNGLRYFISGGGAAHLHNHENPIPESKAFVKLHHYCVIEIDGPTVTLNAYATHTDELFYSAWWIDDMGKDPCSDTDDDDSGEDDDSDDDSDDDHSDDDAADDDDDSGDDGGCFP